jgi:hypothetical protein
MNIKKTVFMLKKLKRDLLKKAYPFETGPVTLQRKLEHYYFLFYPDLQILNWQMKGFDEHGIPLYASYIDVEVKRLVYYPISIGQYGLAVFHDYIKSNSAEKKSLFLKVSDWFYHQKTETENGVFWLTDLPRPEYKIQTPWKSAFAQSRALSVLLRAWQMTEDEKYLNVSKRALIPFTLDISEGGVAANLKSGYPFYEEYVAAEPTMVLDGHFFSLMGILDFIRAVPHELDAASHEMARNIFDKGIESLKHWLPQFDIGFWIRFNYCQMSHYPEIDPCSKSYLRLILAQLKLFHKLTGQKFLNDYYLQWTNYNRLINLIRMYMIKFKALQRLKRL